MDTTRPPSYDPVMPVCGRCGEDNPERARFCLACAAPLTDAVSARREERKRVSVLFCDLVGFTSRAERLDVEDVRGLLAPYYQRLRADLERHGGTVEKFIGDAVMALFGAPIAHEDDPERAVRAAFAVRGEAVAEQNRRDPALDLHVRIGVTTGEALVALDARPAEGEGMAAGDVVNTAARLQAAAPTDGILVDETTWRATERQIAYRPAEPVQAKGKADPVPVWQALGPRASLGVDVAQAPASALVGRERELDLLGAALDRARGGVPQLVTLVGVPGIGKSRLVLELLRRVEAEPELTTWRQGRCLPYGDGVALWALGEMVKAEAGILETDQAAGAAAKLAGAVASLVDDASEAGWVAGHLRPLVGLIDDPRTGTDRRAEAFAAWRRFVEALAERRPTVCVFEDLHWADETLLDFCDHLVDWAADVPLLVLATARPELLARRPGWGGGKANSTIVSLAPLSDGDTARLLGHLLDQALLPAEVQAAVLGRAAGNPLYAEEYARMLADRGFLRRTRTGTWVLAQTDELPLPETVQGIIAARLDALDPRDKGLLLDAAVVGKVGWLGALAALWGGEPLEIERRLHALERKELVRRERRSAVAGERQYAFRHVLVRDVAYGQLPRAARADRHRRVAEWLESLSPDRAEDRAELLVHHWQAALDYATAAGQDAAGLADRARAAARDAGDRALELNAYDAAARWYASALEAWPADDPERPRLLLRLGRAHWLGDQDGGAVLAEASDALLAAGDREGAAEAEAIHGWMLGLQGQGAAAREHDRRAVALLEDAGPSRARAFALTNWAASLMTEGRNDEAIEVGRQALAMAEAVGLDEERSLALNFIGCARTSLGDQGGFADLEQAVAVAVAAHSVHGSHAYGNLSSAMAGSGDLPRAFELLARAREAAERFGLEGDLRWFRAEDVGQAYWQGRWNDALAGADRFIAESRAGSPHFMEPVCRFVRAQVRLARGDLADALKDATAGLELARETDQPQVCQPLLGFHARALLAAGDAGRAGAEATELLELVAELGVQATGIDWSGDLGLVLGALGRGAELLELAAGVPAPTRWLRAGTAVAAGRFAEAADGYAEIGSRPDEAFARLRAGERLLAAGRRSEADRQLEQALAFYREVGAAGYLRGGSGLRSASA
jgi:class 3 adenylate cyclase/tetratricopeptide (TPR) repeat protein